MAVVGMESVSEAVLNRVGAEAESIIKDAETRAKQEIERAEAQRERMLEEQRRRMIEKAEAEAARIRAQALIRAREEILAAKSRVIDDVVARVKSEVSNTETTKKSLLGLIREAVEALAGEKVRLYVSSADLATVRSLQRESNELSERIVDVQELPISGGVIAENVEGSIRIDNDYDTRLGILLPRILPEVAKQLFASR